MNKKEFFYVSNLLSLSRFVLLIFAAFFLFTEIRYHNLWSAGFIFLIWVSDILDGYFARKLNEVTDLGKIIDPLADKVTIIVLAVILLIRKVLPVWFVLILVIRDVIIFSGGVYLKKKTDIVIQSNWTGKLTVFIIGLTIMFSIVFESIKVDFENKFSIYHIEKLELLWNIMILLSIVASIISLIVYFNKFLKIIAQKG
ncbi:MAG: CDP-alcohol phosphatidyltransferase family protein [Ignavibacteria bacterium]